MSGSFAFIKSDWKFLGFSFYWAWMSITFFSAVPYSGNPHAASIAQQAWLWMAAGAIFMRFIHIFLRRKLPSLWMHRSLVILATAVSMVGSSFIFLTAAMPAESLVGHVFNIGGGILCGFGACWCTIMWGEAYTGKSTAESFVLISCTFVVTALVHFFVTSLPSLLSSVLTVLLYGGAYLVLQLILRDSPARPAEEAPARAKPLPHYSVSVLVPLIAILVYASCGEVFHTLLTLPGQTTDLMAMGTWYTLGGGIGSLLLLVVSLVIRALNPSKSDFVCLNTSLVLMAIGVMLPSITPVSLYVSYAVFGAAFWSFRNMVWTYSTKITSDTKASPIVVFATTQNMFAFAILFGSPLVRAITSALHLGDMAWGTVSSVMLFAVLVVALALSLNRQSLWGLLPTPKEARSSSFSLEQQLADRYHLTPRECEVALLLSRGRSVPYIQEKLFISEGTAKSHLKNIYRKLEVNSKQEFLDVIENIERSR